MNLEYCEKVINKLLKNIPLYLKEDCRQAAYQGYLEACEKIKKDSRIRNKSSYMYVSMYNKVLQELALLHGSGTGMFSMPHPMFLKYSKYKAAINNGEDVAGLKMSESTKKVFSNLIVSKRTSITFPNGEPCV